MENEKNRLVLNEVRRMNRLQREKEQSIDEMSEQITYYQVLFDTVIANNRNTNQSIVREIRTNLLRLAILADPKMRTMYRSNPPINTPSGFELCVGELGRLR